LPRAGRIVERAIAKNFDQSGDRSQVAIGIDAEFWRAPEARMPDPRDAHVESNLSVLIASWIRALQPHIQLLVSITTPADPDGPLVSEPENAHSIAAAAMLVFVIESKMERLKAIGRPTRLPNDLTVTWLELQALRNALVHNHVWETTLRSSPEWTKAETIDALVRAGETTRGSYSASVDMGALRTNVLRLHVVPTEVRKWDVTQILPAAVAILDELNAHDVENMRKPADYEVRIDGRLVKLRDIDLTR
jgi:hypothetical protein